MIILDRMPIGQKISCVMRRGHDFATLLIEQLKIYTVNYWIESHKIGNTTWFWILHLITPHDFAISP